MDREELRQTIIEIVDEVLKEKLERRKEIDVLERLIRVEEELKALREVQSAMMREMGARFAAMDERFEALLREIDARFRAVDERFESIEKRITFLEWFVGIGFTALVVLMSLYKFLG